jgi:hypothetical protein
MTTWYRSETNVRLGGICGGLAEILHIDATIIRFILLVIIFTPCPIIFAYLVAWLIVPKKGEVHGTSHGDGVNVASSTTNQSSPSDTTSKKEFLVG